MSHQLKVYQTRLRKRKQAEEYEQQAKRHREEKEEEETMMVNQTKLTDVNVDCLEFIFNHLSFDDLLSIADTSKELKPAADLVFNRIFSRKYFNILLPDSNQITHFDNWIEIKCLKTALKTLRNFGHLISKLYIQSWGMWSDEIVNYTNRYCSKSLTEIEFYGLGIDDRNPNDLFQNFMPFINVEEVCFSYCTLNEQFSTLFPKLHSLTLLHVQAYHNCIATHFPHLQRLEITGRRPNQAVIRSLIRLNPQLRGLVLRTTVTALLIRFINEHLPLLEHLEVQFSWKALLELNGDVIAFERLRHLKIDYDFYELTSARVPITSEVLEEFSYKCKGRRFNNIINFLKDHPSIIKLNIKNTIPNSLVIIAREVESRAIAEALPLLQEINFKRISLSIESVIPFTEYATLKTMRFPTNRARFEELKARLGNEWQITVDNNNQVELKRND